MDINFQKALFYKSAFKTKDLPPESRSEIAFAGRSNVGKSSTINLLTAQSKLAKVSKTPGRTTSINFFTLVENTFLVDLPGYGYAKVSHTVKEQWQKFICDYILEREMLRGVVLVVDCRHPFTKLDQDFLALCALANRLCHVLLNKADKLSNNEKTVINQKIVSPILRQYDNLSAQFFSAFRGEGLKELHSHLNKWLA